MKILKIFSITCIVLFVACFAVFNKNAIACIIGECDTQPVDKAFSNKAYNVEVIDFCELSAIPSGASRLILLGDGTNKLSGWNHIGKPQFKSEFANISQGPSSATYSYKKPLKRLLPEDESNSINAHTDCYEQAVFPMTLVKKYGDSSRKHANGIQTSLMNTTYGELDKIRLYLKFDSTISNIPTFAQLQNHYGSILTDTELMTLYDPNLTMKLSFAATNTKDSNDFIGDIIIKVDSQYIDKWVLIEVDVAHMSFYAGQWFKRLPKSLDNNLQTKVSKFKITAEAYGTQTDPQKQGQTAKGLGSTSTERWQALAIDELYKELGVVIAQVEVITK